MLTGYFLFSTALALVYAGLLHRYVRAWRRLPTWELPPDFEPQTPVSVLIPARNEAATISACLEAWGRCAYPRHLLELLVIDDNSSDTTGDIAWKIAASSNLNIRVLRLSEAPSLEGHPPTGKKKALEWGVAQARGALIVSTDADAQPSPKGLLLLVSLFETQQPKAIAGPVQLREGHTLLQHFQALDFAGLMGITGAGIQLGWQHLGNGAHLAYPKAVFEAVGGFAGSEDRASGDDLFLLQNIARRWPDGIRFLKNAEATVLTDPCPDARSFFQQRLRWGTKNAALPERPVKLVLALVLLFCWSILLNAGLAIFYPPLAWLLAGQLALKAIADFRLLAPMCRFFKAGRLLRWFWPSFLLHLLYIAGAGLASLYWKEYEWKGRRLR
ncbi:MAG: glycosyltransferase [Saprospiraceae bacterium]|nr:glycosyltransferase [Saprospiraceae bacterium]